MKLINYALAVFILLFQLIACNVEEKKQPEPQQDPTISFNITDLTASKDGETMSVGYTIENPVEGETVSITASQDWITNLDTSIDGVVVFDVLPNDAMEVRTASLNFQYAKIEASVQISQEAADPAPFSFENMRAEMTSYTVDIYPLDKEAPYIAIASTPTYMAVYDLDTDEALFEDDMEYFEYLAEYYSMSVSELLSMITHIGDEVGFFANEGIVPGCNYILYAYHVNIETLELESKIVRFPFKTAAPDQIEVDFTMDIAVNGALVEWTINPNDYDGYYYFDAVDMELFNEVFDGKGDFETYAIEYTNELMLSYQAAGNSNAAILQAICRRGETTMKISSLKPEKEYAFFAVAIDEATVYAASAPDYEMVRTEEVEAVEMEISISLENLEARAATIKYTPSSNEPFAANCFTKAEYDSYGSTDQERLDNIKFFYSLSTVFGEVVYDFSDLNPETEYVAFAFGYNGGVLTTPIFTEVFTTPSADQAAVILTLLNEDYYDVYAVSQAISNFASFSFYTNEVFFPMEVSVRPAFDKAYFHMYPLSGKEEYTDDDWIRELLYAGPQTDFSRSSIFTYDIPYIFVGFATDSEGKYGPLYKKEFTFTRDGVSDVQGFYEWWSGEPATPLGMMYRKHNLEGLRPTKSILNL
ncbi:MAG: BACON domain-containing protein [Bacteroidales bacterium]|nr:BACON domain-containing protein [Bacteroidales bacterium]